MSTGSHHGQIVIYREFYRADIYWKRI